MKWSLARQDDPNYPEDGFQFFFIKQGRLYNPAPTIRPVTLIL
jgi:hypothetical protein